MAITFRFLGPTRFEFVVRPMDVTIYRLADDIGSKLGHRHWRDSSTHGVQIVILCPVDHAIPVPIEHCENHFYVALVDGLALQCVCQRSLDFILV